MFAIYLSSQVSPQLLETAAYFAESLPEVHFDQDEQNRFAFSGRILDLEEKLVIDEIVSRSGGAILDTTVFSKEVLKKSLSELESLAESENMKVKFSIGSGKMSVQSASSSELSKLRSLFPWLKSHSKPRSKVPVSRKSVFLELAFVEIRKEALERLGLRFGSPIEFGTSIFVDKISSPRSALKVSSFNPIGSFLDFALQDGQAKVHFKQSVIGQDKKRAVFQVGGEYSVRLHSENSAQLGKINYGIDLDFTPEIISSDQLHIRLKAQVREPDLAGGLDGLPLIQTKNLETQMYAKLGETIAIGGFVRSQRMRSSQKLPVLGEIPVFGRLFTSKDFMENKSEAYLFITPRELKTAWQPQLGEKKSGEM